MNKTDDQLRGSISCNERLAEIGGVAVVAGLIGEVVLTWEFQHGESFAERWGPVIMDALIALGVAAEVLFSRRARARSEELQRRSEERIAESERETARLKAQFGWRALTAEEVAALVGALKQTYGSVTLLHVMNEVESANFALQFAAVFDAAKWRFGIVSASYGTMALFGIRIPPPNTPGGGRSAEIQAALTAAGLEFEVKVIPEWISATATGYTGGTGASHTNLLIGPVKRPFAK